MGITNAIADLRQQIHDDLRIPGSLVNDPSAIKRFDVLCPLF